MKILVRNRKFAEDHKQELMESCNIISIFSSEKEDVNCFSPFKNNAANILKLQFDDLTIEDKDNNETSCKGFIFFNVNIAKEIHNWLNTIDQSKPLFIHCDAGISRSGAVGFVLNEFFNKFKTFNSEDIFFFNMQNQHISPNNLVVKLLKDELFGETDFSKVF